MSARQGLETGKTTTAINRCSKPMVGRLLKYGRGGTMIQRVCGGVGLLLFVLIVFAAQDVVSAVGGTVKKVDAGAKTMAVKTVDGAEQTFHFFGRPACHGTET